MDSSTHYSTQMYFNKARRFLSHNSMQFLSRSSCNFKIARVNQLPFQCDFSAICGRGLRCNSRNTVNLSSSNVSLLSRRTAFVYTEFTK